MRVCRCDGIGRLGGLKIRWRKRRVGSNPTTGTTTVAYIVFTSFLVSSHVVGSANHDGSPAGKKGLPPQQLT